MTDSASSRGPFSIEPATDEDFPWVLDALAKDAYTALLPARQKGVTEELVRQSLEQETAPMRGPGGPPHQVFMARDVEGLPVGCVWLVVGAVGFARQPGVFILGLHVEPDCRSEDVGRRLAEEAEVWARAGGVSAIDVHPAARGYPSPADWEAWGFDAEKIQVSKGLGSEG